MRETRRYAEEARASKLPPYGLEVPVYFLVLLTEVPEQGGGGGGKSEGLKIYRMTKGKKEGAGVRWV